MARPSAALRVKPGPSGPGETPAARRRAVPPRGVAGSRRLSKRNDSSAALWRRALIPGMVAGLLGAGGCADRAGGSDVQVRSEIRRPEPPPPLSPAQRDRGFRRFFSEGVRLAGARRFGPASAAFEAAVRLKPDSAEALFNLGACYEELGDPMRAVHLYRRVLGLTPDDPACYFNLGTSYIKMYHRDQSPGWRKMARDAWRRSLELNPDQPEVERFLARTEGLE